jgi:hypothetical protein
MASFCFGRFLATLVLGLTGATAAFAQPKPDCSTEALGELSVAQRVALISGACSEVTQYALEKPGGRYLPLGSAPSLVKARFGSATAQPLFDGLLGTFKFSWSGQRAGQETSPLNQQLASFGAGGLLKLADFWSLQANVGRELGLNRDPGATLRSRTALASVLQPTRQSTLFAEWAENETGLTEHRVGAQWWLMPKHLVLDVGARYLAEGIGWTDRRVGLKFQMTH